MRQGKIVFSDTVSMARSALIIYPANADDVFIEYFHMSGCQDCEKTDPIIAGIISILIGLNMLGILKIPLVLDDYFKKSAKNMSAQGQDYSF